MKHRRLPSQFWLIALCLTGACVAHAADVQIWGRPLSYWFDQIEQRPSTVDQQNYDAFREAGTNALPFLIDILERKPSFIATQADDMRRKYPKTQRFLRSLPSARDEQARRWGAAVRIANLGTNAAPALPALMKLWNDTNDHAGRIDAGPTLEALGAMVAAYAPDFIRDLSPANEAAIRLTGLCGPKARAAAPKLRQLASNGNPYISIIAAKALWEVDRDTNIFLSVFSGLLTNQNAMNNFRVDLVDLQMTKGLYEMGDGARLAVPVVSSLLSARNPFARQWAVGVLRWIDPTLVAPMTSGIGSNSAANVTALVRVIWTNGDGKDLAFDCLCFYGPEARAAVPTLIKIMNRGDDESRCVDVLTEIGPPARDAVPALIAMLPHNGPGAARALGAIGPSAKDAIPELKRRLLVDDPFLRWRAADAIARIAPEEVPDLDIFLKRLEHLPMLQVHFNDASQNNQERVLRTDPASGFFRVAAKTTLWRLGKEKEPPVGDIVDEVNKQMAERYSVYFGDLIRLLGDIGPKARPALPLLESMLPPFSDYSAYQWEATIAIRKIDPHEADRLGLPGTLALP